MTNETSIVLDALTIKKDWKIAENLLFESGLVSSKKRANELKNEIRRRLDHETQNLPRIDDLIIYHRKNLNETEKKELNYIFLYYSDEYFRFMVDLIRDIDNSTEINQIISRNTLKKMLVDSQKAIGENPKEKTINNWIGRYISILKDTKILIPKEKNDYIINFGFISRKTWTFFCLCSYFNKIDLLKAPIFLPFNMNDQRITRLVKESTTPSIKYKILREGNEITTIEMDVQYRDLEDWVMNQNE